MSAAYILFQAMNNNESPSISVLFSVCTQYFYDYTRCEQKIKINFNKSNKIEQMKH